jgi:hypothetical protein
MPTLVQLRRAYVPLAEMQNSSASNIHLTIQVIMMVSQNGSVIVVLELVGGQAGYLVKKNGKTAID